MQTTGEFMSEVTMDAYANKLVENTFLPFFTMSTDVTDISEFVLKTGCLWRYVRASMSVIGITPPVVDRGVSDHLLVDGGYVNNVPTRVMKQVGTGRECNGSYLILVFCLLLLCRSWIHR